MAARADDLVIQTETPGSPATLFRIMIGGKIICEGLTVSEAYGIAGDILERLAPLSLLRRRTMKAKPRQVSPALPRQVA
jgi:hypothetical protein